MTSPEKKVFWILPMILLSDDMKTTIFDLTLTYVIQHFLHANSLGNYELTNIEEEVIQYLPHLKGEND